ncbi:uncharacterized protein LOC120287432 [Eucalyptus grandis]|uniref:uncharacterized protein LOC120287432 n=1 Tax=Eucalyptus grandis TaxID=71139 RepID=UPI00192ECBE8|nr:uncharacterized protein LOC120287432 [Eucalyptus grandis]
MEFNLNWSSVLVELCDKKLQHAEIHVYLTVPTVSFCSCIGDVDIKKTYWITCNVDPDIQQLSTQAIFVVRPRDLNRLLANFQSSLQEITIIATERNSDPSDAASEFDGKAVEFRSYVDPTKENDSLLHTQLWIDPAEEFVQYAHNGNPVDVTFAVKELKAFLAFCEGCEVDIHLRFEKAGE